MLLKNKFTSLICIFIICATNFLAAHEDQSPNEHVAHKKLEKIDKKLSKLLCKKHKIVSKVNAKLTPEKQAKLTERIANSNKLSDSQKAGAMDALDQATAELEKATKE